MQKHEDVVGRQGLEAEQAAAGKERPVDAKNGFSVVAPINVSSPASTEGSRASCCARLNRWTSSRNRTVPRPCSAQQPCERRPTVSRTSFTPAETADRPTKARLVAPAIRRASVVFPVPRRPPQHRRSSSGRLR